jgi:hypothetical protein
MNASAGTWRTRFPGIAHAETDRRRVHPDKTLVRDRHPMRVAREVLVEHLLRAAEGLFRVEHPIVRNQLPTQRLPGLRVGQRCRQRLVPASGFPQPRHELATEDTRQRPDRKQKAALGRLPFSRGRQRPAGDQGVHMHVPPEVLLPRVQDQRERQLATQPATVGAELAEGGPRGAKQHLVDHARALCDQCMEGMWQGKDEVEVRYRQQLPTPFRQPVLLGSRLALRTVAVAARMIDVARYPAAVTGLDVAAEDGRATGDDRPPDLGLDRRQDVLGEVRPCRWPTSARVADDRSAERAEEFQG